jgi:hypothetical protein
MSNEPETTSLPPEGRLEDAVALYFHAVDAGRAPDRRAWVARYPDLADGLEKFFAEQERMQRFAEPLLPPASPDSWPEFDDFEVLEEIGRGAMGVVYKARQKSVPRPVALKVLRAAASPGPEERARFVEEVSALASLEHPNIVRIYAAGEQDGRLFFAQELLKESLARRLEGTPMPARKAAELLEELALAAHHAHRKRFIHCDLKPGNVLLKEDGTPQIADFGLARHLASQAGRTRDGEIVGTPPYMAPEQARGATREIDPRTDVYALGAILYECLTGRPPFKGETVGDTLKQVLTREPVRPRQLNPRVPGRLEAICLRCLRKSPGDRYASGAELAAELRAYLEPKAIDSSPIATLVLLLAAVFAGRHLAVFLLIHTGGPEWLLWLSVFAAYPLGFAALRANRDAPTVARQPQRLLWSIWGGQMLAVAAIFLSCRLTAGADYAAGFLLAYPGYAALTGLAIFVKGSTYWSWEYAFGLAWIALAALMALAPPYAPLAAAGLSAASHVTDGLHLRRLRLEAAQSPRRDQR